MTWIEKHVYIAPEWRTTLWLLLSALLAWLFVFIEHLRLRRKPVSQMMQASTNALATVPAKFNAKEYFRLSYYSPLQGEVEANIRAAANETQPNDREGFYVKFIGFGFTAYQYDLIWWSIFKSQLLALLELNRKNGLLPLSEIKRFYDQAVVDYPDAYAARSFEQWLEYMKEQILLFRHPSDMVEITVKGKDFLKYLLHWGRESSQKSL